MTAEQIHNQMEALKVNLKALRDCSRDLYSAREDIEELLEKTKALQDDCESAYDETRAEIAYLQNVLDGEEPHHGMEFTPAIISDGAQTVERIKKGAGNA